MSVVVRHPDGRLVLYVKGADEVIFQRLKASNSCEEEELRGHLAEFGEAGLRTLVMAKVRSFFIFSRLSPEFLSLLLARC